MQLGKTTQDGFLPSPPNLEDMFKAIGLGDKGKGWDGLEQSAAASDVASSQKTASDDLKRCYVQFAASPAGQQILEHLLDMTLRRACSHPDANAGIEQEALYGRERKGQNAIVVSILKMIVDGQNLPELKKKKSSKSK